MAAIKEDQLKNTSEFMTVLWKYLVKPYYNPEDGDEYWLKMFATINKISQKYCQTDKRLQMLLVGFENGLEKVWKDRNGRSN